jgi:hypothetical protein
VARRRGRLWRAQTGRVRQIGVLMSGSDSDAEMRAEVLALQNGLHEIGWIEGRNIHFEFRWGQGDTKRTLGYATELVGLAAASVPAPKLSAPLPVRVKLYRNSTSALCPVFTDRD